MADNETIEKGVDTLGEWADVVNSNAVNSTPVGAQRSYGSPLLEKMLFARGKVTLEAVNTGYREVTIAKAGDTYYMYADAVADTNPNYPETFGSTIYGFSTTDSIWDWDENSWTPLGEVLPVGAGGSFDEGGTATPSVLYLGGTFYLFYTGRGVTTGANPSALGYATSTDGVNFTKQGQISISIGTDIDDDACVAYNPVTDKVFLYYAKGSENPDKRVWLYESPASAITTTSWTDMGMVYETVGTQFVPSDVYYDYQARCFILCDSDSDGAFSYDGYSWEELSTDYARPPGLTGIHLTFVKSEYGQVEGIMYNGSSLDTVYISYRVNDFAINPYIPQMSINDGFVFNNTRRLCVKQETEGDEIVAFVNTQGRSVHAFETDALGNAVVRIKEVGNSPTIIFYGVDGKIETTGSVFATGLNLSGIPTSPSGLNSGDVWRNGTSLEIV